MKSRIKKLLNEAVVAIINENRLEFMIKTYTAKDAKFRISPEQLLAIMKADPTTRPVDPARLEDVQKVGNYVQWLVNQLKKIYPKKDEKGNVKFSEQDKENIHFFFEDIYRATEALEKFEVMKRRHLLPQDKKDINQVKDIAELRQITKNFDMSNVEAEKEAKAVKKERSKEFKVQYEDERWLVVTPLTFEASKAWFASPVTDWCTASPSYGSKYYEQYMKENPLYSVIDKSQPPPKATLEGKPVLQIHFGNSIQFKNEDDHEIDVRRFFEGQDGLKAWLQPIMKQALEHRAFSMSDRLYTAYIGLYGATDEIKVIIDNSFKNLIQENKNGENSCVVIDGEGNGIKADAYIQMLGYEEVLNKIFKYVNPDVKRFEIKFKKYDGGGYPIPDSIGQMKNCKTMVFTAFPSHVPHSIVECDSLDFLVLDYCKNLKTIPDFICQIKKLEVFNYKGTKADLPQCLLDMEAQSGLLLI